MLNRAALIVRPAEPFVAWARSLDTGTEPDVHGDQTVFLVPEYDDEDDVAHMLLTIYDTVFAEALYGWSTDRARWPAPRTYAMFRQWFTIELHSIVVDLSADPLVDDGH